MTDIATLVIKADTSQVKTANRDLDNLSGASRKAESSSQKLTSAFISMRGALAAVGIGLSVSQLIKVSDSYTKLTSQLRLATRSQEEFNEAYANVQRISQVAQSSIEETTVLYARLSTSLQALNATQKQVSDITEAVSLGLRISGASAQEAAATMLQLSQAFGAGALTGDEFRSVNETAPRIMKALADSLGVARGELKGMAADGLLTSDVIGNALLKSVEQFRKEAKETQNISGGFQAITNEFTLLVGEIDKATGASSLLTKALAGIAQGIRDLRTGEGGWLENVIKGIPVVGSIYGAYDMIAPDRLPKGNSASGTIRRASDMQTGDGLLKPPVIKPVVDDAESRKKLKELSDLRQKAIEEDNAAEVKRLNVAIWVNEQIFESNKKIADEKQKNIDLLQEEAEKLRDLINPQREINREIERMNELWRLGFISSDEWQAGIAKIEESTSQAVDKVNDQFKDLKNAINGYSKDMAKSMTDWIFGTETSFNDMIRNMLMSLAQMTLQKNVTDPLLKIGGDFLGGLIPSLSLNAKGGTYSGAGISAYSGKVVDSPTLFPFAKGIGLMGEAGAEAILPLSRGSDGKLGVMAQGGGNNISITINENGGRTQQGASSFQLAKEIESAVVNVLIKQRRQGGLLNA